VVQGSDLHFCKIFLHNSEKKIDIKSISKASVNKNRTKIPDIISINGIVAYHSPDDFPQEFDRDHRNIEPALFFFPYSIK